MLSYAELCSSSHTASRLIETLIVSTVVRSKRLDWLDGR
jgi:hypothetical protein